MSELQRPDADQPIPAGSYADWLASMTATLRDGADSDVACGSCDACCRSSQFVHIGPEERDTLAHIPAALRFAAPHLPGHVLLGYDRDGRCPMLGDQGCTIYEHRPRACRVYDCRIFPATGLDPDPDQTDIGARARRWRFDETDERDRQARTVVTAAVRFLDRHGDDLPSDVLPDRPPQRAAAAVRIADLFADTAEPTIDEVAVRLRPPEPRDRPSVPPPPSSPGRSAPR